MSKRLVFLCTILLTTTIVKAQEPALSEQPTTTTVDTVLAAPAAKAETAAKPKKNAIVAFTQFVRIFIALIRNPEIKDNLQTIENLLIALLQTAHQVAQASNPAQTRSLSNDHNDALITELSHALVSESESLEMQRACTHQKHSGMDDQTKAILLNFAAVVQNFFNILQDPENKDNVAPNIMGMVAGMMNIGTIAATKSHGALSDESEIISYAQSLDAETKQTMRRMIFTAQKRCPLSYS